MRILPITIDDTECNVFVRGTRAEIQETSLIVSRLLDEFERRCFRFIDEVRVEDVELRKE